MIHGKVNAHADLWSGFKEAAVKRLNQVLHAHGVTEGAFEEVAPDHLRRVVRLQGKKFVIGVTTGMVVMESTDGRCRYEPLLRQEFSSGQAMIDGFATRLDRLLDGGPWELPDEVDSLVDKLIRLVRRVFGRSSPKGGA